MSCPASSSALNARAANSGVPAKTRRRKELRALAKLLGKPRADALLLELRQALDEHLALEMIHLVLDADRQQPLGFERKGVAIGVAGTHFHPFGALQRVVDAGHGKAAFLDVGDAASVQNLWIDQHHQRITALGNVDYDYPLVHIDLGRGKADAGSGIHGFGHVGDKLLERTVENGDW